MAGIDSASGRGWSSANSGQSSTRTWAKVPGDGPPLEETLPDTVAFDGSIARRNRSATPVRPGSTHAPAAPDS